MPESLPLNPGPVFPASIAKIRQIIASIDTKIDLATLKDRTRFKDAGADSLDFFNIIIAIEDAFGVVIPSEDLHQANSLEKLTEYLNSRLP